MRIHGIKNGSAEMNMWAFTTDMWDSPKRKIRHRFVASDLRSVFFLYFMERRYSVIRIKLSLFNKI
jgi:hypothetical protein